MTHSEIREKFLKFFESRGHKIVPSSSLLPTDSSVLFTTAGMQQFKPYYTGVGDAMKDFDSLNTVSIQKSMRTSDIDSVGDESHLTFFEMLGNFSFGGYWKKEAIELAHEFITKEIGLEIQYVTVFEGWKPTGLWIIGPDDESRDIWKSLGLRDDQIKNGGFEDNFWGPTGDDGPCGPTTEIYVDGLEIWNIVFNEYYKSKYPENNNDYKPLQTKGIDTGMGLERLAMVIQDKKNIFETDLFEPIIKKIRELIPNIGTKSERIVADHLRASLLLISDGVIPSNKEQGYVLRKLIRRAVTHANIFDMSFDSKGFGSIASSIIEVYKNYSELGSEQNLDQLSVEIRKFRKTLENGLKILNREMVAREMIHGEPIIVQDLSLVSGFPGFTPSDLDGKWLFDFYQTFGFPPELVFEVLKIRGRIIDPSEQNLLLKDFKLEYEKHQEQSRAGAEKKFGGHGIVSGDISGADPVEIEKKTRLHTATHVVVAALEKVLGQKLPQAGSDISVERLRFDFSFPRKVTPEEIKQAQDIANEIVDKDLPVTCKEMDLQEALNSGASAFFKLKYPPRVKVYTIGNESDPFSRELCGGPHVSHTAEIGHITITKEESVSGGNRRIRATIS